MVSRAEEIRSMRKKGLGASNLGEPRASDLGELAETQPSSARINCPICDEDISSRAKKCRHCGETLDVSMRKAEEVLRATERSNSRPATGSKSKIVAFLFAWFLGAFGGHKFYLNRTGQGILYLVFFWTLIPALVSMIEGIIYLASDDEDFRDKYG